MANRDIVTTSAGKYQSPFIDEHKRKALRLYAKVLYLWGTIGGTDFRAEPNTSLMFSRAATLFAGIPGVVHDASPQELAIWFDRVTTDVASVGTTSTSTKLSECASFLKQSDKALCEADLYVTGLALTLFT